MRFRGWRRANLDLVRPKTKAPSQSSNPFVLSLSKERSAHRTTGFTLRLVPAQGQDGSTSSPRTGRRGSQRQKTVRPAPILKPVRPKPIPNPVRPELVEGTNRRAELQASPFDLSLPKGRMVRQAHHERVLVDQERQQAHQHSSSPHFPVSYAPSRPTTQKAQ
jgi:hypothetical protein